MNDAYLEAFTERDKFEAGVWYYSAFSHVDHLDFCGMPPFWSKIRTILGLEYRPLLWVNLYNRLRTLSIKDQE